MKTSLVAILMLSAASVSLAGCQTSNSQAMAPSETRDVYVAGQGYTRDVQIPANTAEANAETPYAVRGNDQSNSTASTPLIGANGSY